ncbi:MAG: NAD(P) transhydrogenase subunit alpha, partial [Planctomycetota bacterium]
MIVGIPKETRAGESRVSLVPSALLPFTKAGIEVHVESGAGIAAGHPDSEYQERDAKIAASRSELFANAQVILQVRSLGANLEAGAADLELLREGQTTIGFCDPLGKPEAQRQLAQRRVTTFSMELMPRTTRAQSMDALSAMATIAGYKAVLMAANALPRIFPMLMTAAGTLAPARVLVIGVGVAGLQAIATARRLGAVVEAFDVRPEVKEQVQSVGAKFVELNIETSGGEGGYAKEQNEEFYKKQQKLMGEVVAANNVVITTAAVPGKKAPLLVTADMVRKMAPGSVIVDVAAERGGNCELTRPGETVVEQGVTILGPENLPSSVPD